MRPSRQVVFWGLRHALLCTPLLHLRSLLNSHHNNNNNKHAAAHVESVGETGWVARREPSKPGPPGRPVRIGGGQRAKAPPL